MLPPKVPMVPDAQGTDIVPVSRDGGERWRVSLNQIRKWLIASGITGSPGPQGPPGADGAKGDTGPAGAIGEAGSQGAQGVKGEAGAVGQSGVAGQQGTAGPQGATGAKGDTGVAGAAGAAGAAGKDASSLVGDIVVGETIVLAVNLAGIRRVVVTTPVSMGVAVGQSFIAIPTAAVPAGYAIHDVIVTAANKLSIAVSVPALAIGSIYSIPCRLHRLNS